MYISLRGSPSVLRGRGAVSRTVVLLGFVSLLTDVSSEAVTAVMPLYITTGLGLSVFAYSVVDGLHQGASTLVRLPAALTSDHLDRPKWVALSGYGVSAVSKVGLLLLSSLTAIAAVVAVDRIGKGIRTAPRDNLIVLASEPRQLGRAFGVHRTLDTIGACLGPVLAFGILQFLPGRFSAVFVVSLAFAIVGALLLALVVPDLRQRSKERSERRPPRPPLRELLSAPVRSLVLVAGLMSLLSVGDGLLYLALLDSNHISALWLPLLAVGTNIVYLVLAIPVGTVADRMGRPRLFVFGHLALVLAYVCAVLPGPGLVLAALTLVGLGTYYAGTDGLIAALSGEVAAPGTGASTIALSQTVVAVCRLVASMAFGLMWVWAGPAWALVSFGTALALAVPLSLLLLRRGGLRVDA